MIKGLALALGGLFWALLNIAEWRRWRSGEKPRLPWYGWANTDLPRTEMNRLVEAASMAGNVVLGLALAALGGALILAA